MTENQPSVRKSFWKRKSFLFVAIPLSIAMMVFVYVASVQYRASQRVVAEVQRIRLANLPIDSETQSQWFIANSSREHSDAWAEILMLGSVGVGETEVMDKFPYLGNAPIPLAIDPDQPWPHEPVVSQWLEMTKPLIDKIHAVTRSKQPTWQPLTFDGAMTLLEPIQNSRNLARILQVEVEHALYIGDSERAMRGLQSLDGLAYAFDWNLCLVADLVAVALRGIHFAMIQRSLSLDIWTEAQLVELSSQVAQRQDLAKRWRATIAGERGLMFDWVTDQGFRDDELGFSGIEFLFSIPSVQESLLIAYSQIEAIADQGIDKLAENALVFERRLRPDGGRGFSIEHIGVGTLMPAVQAFAAAVIRSEDSRRFTLAAIAIKRYQLAKGQFPERLVQLKDIGLDRSDWTTVGGDIFGYTKEDTKGDTAYLWSYSFRDTKVMPQERPALDEDGMQQLVTIR